MMKKELIYFLLMTLPVFCFAQKASSSIDYPVSGIPDSLYENANSVIRSARFDLLVHHETKITYTKKAVITILNRKSSHKSLQVYYNDFINIKYMNAAIYDRNGRKIRAAGKKDISDFSLTDHGTIAADGRLKEIDLVHVQYPYTLVYEYEIEVDESYFMPDWKPAPSYNTAVQFSSCEITTLGSQNILFKENLIRDRVSERRNGKENIKYWEISNFKAIEKEPLGQPAKDLFPSVYLTSEILSLGKILGKSDSWESFSKFFYTLNEKHNDISEELKDKIREITKTANSDKEKINILYSFLQENTRYVSIQLGVGGWKSFKGSFVEKNKYGDCKALTYFMKSLLEEVNVTAYPALIRNGKNPRPIEEDFVSPSFNHIILYVPEENIWLECTSSSSYPGLIGSSNSSRKALLVKETGGGIIETPTVEKSHINIRNILEISDAETMGMSSEIKLEGEAHEKFRAWKKYLTNEEQSEAFEKNIKCSIKANTLDFEIMTKPASPEASLKITYEPINLISKSSKRIFLPIKSNIDFYSINLPHMENRKQRILLQNEKELTETTKVIIPQGYQLESLPEAVSITSDFGSFTISFAENPDGIEIVKKGDFHKGEFAADNYSKLVEYYNTIKATNNLSIVFVLKK